VACPSMRSAHRQLRLLRLRLAGPGGGSRSLSLGRPAATAGDTEVYSPRWPWPAVVPLCPAAQASWQQPDTRRGSRGAEHRRRVATRRQRHAEKRWPHMRGHWRKRNSQVDCRSYVGVAYKRLYARNRAYGSLPTIHCTCHFLDRVIFFFLL
jgi:hypothetical protein